jgi:hypothetical protein
MFFPHFSEAPKDSLFGNAARLPEDGGEPIPYHTETGLPLIVKGAVHVKDNGFGSARPRCINAIMPLYSYWGMYVTHVCNIGQ